MIDWTKPIEIVGSAGDAHHASFTENGEDSFYPMRIESEVGNYWSCRDGKVPCTEYTIRNVATTERPMPEPTATWWARRWYDSASPDEREAMRVILAGEG